jgi:hypothetical protein
MLSCSQPNGDFPWSGVVERPTKNNNMNKINIHFSKNDELPEGAYDLANHDDGPL